MEIVEIRAADLVLDFDLYPRLEISSTNVRSIADAIEQGAEVPPVIIDAASKRVIDGFHRTRAFLNVHGDEAMIPCIEKHYASEEEMFLDATRFNSEHGRALSPVEKTKCAHRLQEYGVEWDEIASVLHIPAVKLEKMINGRLAKNGANRPVVLKRPLAYLAGTKLTKKQSSANRHSSGWPIGFHVNQILLMIRSNCVNLEDPKVMESLTKLHETLGEFVQKHQLVSQ